MRIQLRPIVASVGLLGLVTVPTLAAADTNNIHKLESQIASLQQQVSALKNQMQHHHPHHCRKKHISGAHVHTPTSSSDPAATPCPGTVENSPEIVTETSYDDDEDSDRPYYHGHPLCGRDLINLIREEKQYLPFDLDVPGQAFVSTGPYVGVPLQYSGSNLIVNTPSVNTDVQLLSIRKSIHKQLMAMGGEISKEPYHSHLLLSGVIGGQAGYLDRGSRPSQSGFDISNVSLDAFFIGPSEWILGFIEFSYDSSAPINNNVFQSTSYYTVSNSRVFVNKAFVTLGDFSCSPFYASFGQFYVPFGAYSSVMVSTPFTTVLGRTKARSLLVGYQQQDDNSFYGAAYLFRGDSHATTVSTLNNAGVNLGYKYKCGCFNGNLGGGLIANIADSGGMQIGNGFNNNEQLAHRVPGYDVRGVFGLGEHFDIIGELIATTNSFSVNDMSYNGHGAKPWAFDIEGGYTFSILNDRPSTIALGYQKSTEALSLGIPMTRYSLVFNTSLLRNTLQAIEIRHDKNYAASDTANGPVPPGTPPGSICTAKSCSASGKGDNAITASFDYYF